MPDPGQVARARPEVQRDSERYNACAAASSSSKSGTSPAPRSAMRCGPYRHGRPGTPCARTRPSSRGTRARPESRVASAFQSEMSGTSRSSACVQATSVYGESRETLKVWTPASSNSALLSRRSSTSLVQVDVQANRKKSRAPARRRRGRRAAPLAGRRATPGRPEGGRPRRSTRRDPTAPRRGSRARGVPRRARSAAQAAARRRTRAGPGTGGSASSAPFRAASGWPVRHRRRDARSGAQPGCSGPRRGRAPAAGGTRSSRPAGGRMTSGGRSATRLRERARAPSIRDQRRPIGATPAEVAVQVDAAAVLPRPGRVSRRG